MQVPMHILLIRVTMNNIAIIYIQVFGGFFEYEVSISIKPDAVACICCGLSKC